MAAAHPALILAPGDVHSLPPYESRASLCPATDRVPGYPSMPTIVTSASPHLQSRPTVVKPKVEDLFVLVLLKIFTLPLKGRQQALGTKLMRETGKNGIDNRVTPLVTKSKL